MRMEGFEFVCVEYDCIFMKLQYLQNCKHWSLDCYRPDQNV